MTDFNQILTPGDVENGIVNVVVEIPAGSNQKIEWNHKTLTMEIDRLEPTDFPQPTNYGFIPQTISGDGDELDTLIICDEPLATSTTLEAKIIGVIKFDDEGESDDKIIVVPIDDKINSLDDITKSKIDQITDYFNHYKDSKKLELTTVKSWGNIDEAKKVIGKSIERWKNC